MHMAPGLKGNYRDARREGKAARKRGRKVVKHVAPDHAQTTVNIGHLFAHDPVNQRTKQPPQEAFVHALLKTIPLARPDDHIYTTLDSPVEHGRKLVHWIGTVSVGYGYPGILGVPDSCEQGIAIAFSGWMGYYTSPT